jgi:uncharacterized protein (TIGR02246 family)
MTTSAAEAQIRLLLGRMSEAWNRGDMAAFDAAFTADVDFVDTAGVWYRGRDAVQAVHAREIGTTLKGTAMTTEQVSVRVLSDDIAVAQAENLIQPAGRRVMMTLVASRTGDGWSFLAAQSTLVA